MPVFFFSRFSGFTEIFNVSRFDVIELEWKNSFE
jgi:hypothetical protein